MRNWAFAVSPSGLGLTGEQFWDLTQREFYALRYIWETPRDDAWYRWAALMAKVNNMWSSKGPAHQPSDYYDSPRRKGKAVPKYKLADPLDPNGTQTVENKMFMMRSMLMDAAAQLPPDLPPVDRTEMPAHQREAIEAAWRDYELITGGGKPPN